LADVNHPALAIDVAHFQQRCLGAAKNHQQLPIHQVRRRFDEACHFFRTQPDRQLSGRLGEEQIIVDKIPSLQSLLVEKAQGGHARLHCAGGELLFIEQVKLEPAYLLGSQLFWRPTEVLRELLDREDVAACCRR